MRGYRHIPAVVVLAGFLAAPVAAQDLTCVADTQCRGDAEAMCAPSSLRIEAERRAGRIALWIDAQGPYPADLHRAGEITRLTLPLFKGHALVLAADGRFLYRGNRGKRYSGTCKGWL